MFVGKLEFCTLTDKIHANSGFTCNPFIYGQNGGCSSSFVTKGNVTAQFMETWQMEPSDAMTSKTSSIGLVSVGPSSPTSDISSSETAAVYYQTEIIATYVIIQRSDGDPQWDGELEASSSLSPTTISLLSTTASIGQPTTTATPAVHGSASTNMIVEICIGAILGGLLIIAIILAACIIRRRRRKEATESHKIEKTTAHAIAISAQAEELAAGNNCPVGAELSNEGEVHMPRNPVEVDAMTPPMELQTVEQALEVGSAATSSMTVDAHTKAVTVRETAPSARMLLGVGLAELEGSSVFSNRQSWQSSPIHPYQRPRPKGTTAEISRED